MDLKLFGQEVLSIDGRMNRQPYIYMTLLFYFVPSILFWLCWVLFGFSYFGRIMSIMIQTLIIITNLTFSVRRLHDLGKSGLWYVVIAVPLVNFILVMLLILIKGNAGPNKYGPDPLAMR